MNVLKRLRKSLGVERSDYAASVTQHNGDGSAQVEVDGVSVRVIGTSVPVGSVALIRDGVMIGAAPELPTYDIVLG
jgi:hypothetical protein